jgi:NhaA family Na+:H+ antiporter
MYQGELSSLKKCCTAYFGALGGMVVPAGIFLLLNIGTITQNGAGIPMADIAFAIEFYLFGKSSSYFAQSIFDRACRN